jgi:predicted enzyme related to lactoylglutathione lyase
MRTHLRTKRAAALLVAGLLAVGAAGRALAAPFPPLTTAPSTNHIPGKLLWADLFTSQPDQATKFYCDLFGWTATKIPQKGNFYTIFSNQGVPVAGLAPHSVGKENVGSRWIGYVGVADVKSTVQLAEQNGGTVHGKVRNFPDRGIQAVIADPEGVPLGLLQTTSGDPEDEDTKSGAWNWFQIYSRDPKTAAHFFHAVVGYATEPETHSGRDNEFVLSSEGNNRAGISSLPEGEGITATWLGVIRVDDLDQILTKATSLGGEVLVKPHGVEYGSRFAIISDPTGGTIGLVQYSDVNPAATATKP